MSKIPARSFAIAADNAAACFCITPEQLLTDGTHVAARARIVALIALIDVFPHIKQSTLAAGLGMNLRYVPQAICLAKKSAWWKQEYITRTAYAVNKDLLDNASIPPHIELDSDGNLVLQDDDGIIKQERVNRKIYVPRKYRPARIISSLRQSNVTASLLGDPPPGRREMLEKEIHPYNACSVNGSGEWARSRKASAYLTSRERDASNNSRESA